MKRDIKASVAPDPLGELFEEINNIEVDYDYDGTYEALVSAVEDFVAEYYSEYDCDELEEVIHPSDGVNYIVDYEEAERYAQDVMSEEGGLVRLYYYMGDCNFASDNLYWCNGYGNLEMLTKERLESFKAEILSTIEELQ